MTPFAQFVDTAGLTLSLYPLAFVLKPLVKDVLTAHKQMSWRAGTMLIPPLVVWLVLGMVIRRDKNIEGVLSWMIDHFRWLSPLLPAEHKLVSDGAISHARKRIGCQIFIDLFKKVVGLVTDVEADFHGRKTAMFDGTTASMPDTKVNKAEFTKPGSRRGESAYPQMRIMTLMMMGVRMIIDVAFAPYRGKGTGEKNLMRQLLSQMTQTSLLILLDAGLYAFDILLTILAKDCDFLLKAPNTVKQLKPTRYLPDGSYIATIYGKILDVHAPPSPSGRRTWLKQEIVVRVIPVHIPGFRPFRLITTILEPAVTALELAQHYHRRWDIEIAYDEIKTHLCVTLRGQMPTTFRSKRPDLVTQELYALLIVYDTIRYLIWQSAQAYDFDPCHISFLDVLSHMVDSAPLLTYMASQEQSMAPFWRQLLHLVSTCPIDRPRRPRSSPRVIKVKMSKFNRKQPAHRSQKRNFASAIRIPIPPLISLAQPLS